MQDYNQAGISIIVYAKSVTSAASVISNYTGQDHSKRELILAADDQLQYENWVHLSRQHPMMRVYRMRPGTSRGSSYNYCIERAVYGFISIFGEADEYAPSYLSDSLLDIRRSGAGLVGKCKYNFRSDSGGGQILKESGPENSFTEYVFLPTFLFHTPVFDKVKFTDANEGLDISFCRSCTFHGYKIYSGGRNYYVNRGEGQQTSLFEQF